jgi:hypothetical protein
MVPAEKKEHMKAWEWIVVAIVGLVAGWLGARFAIIVFNG